MPDSYATIDDANAYFASQRSAVTIAWTSATLADQQASLYEATAAIDRLLFTGVKTNEYNQSVNGGDLAVQNLEFPRNGDTVVPDDIVNACCECAKAFLDGVDIDQEIRRSRVESQGFASVRQSYQRNASPLPWILAGIPSYQAWQLLQPYLADPRAIRRIRTT